MQKKDLETILRTQFNLEGKLENIYSELDAVYRLTIHSGKNYVIKISHPGRHPSILEMEMQALAHLRTKSFPYQLQTRVSTVNGDHMVEVSGYYLRVFEWIDSKILADCKPQTTITRQSLGTLLGEVSKGLIDFDCEAGHRFIKWDPSQLLWIKENLKALPEQWQTVFIERINWIELNILPRLKDCPKQLNYNDANDYNILCQWNENSRCYEVTGIIDFLDLVHTHRINELAIGCVYSILYLNDPLPGAAEIVAAYHTANPLEDVELEVLYAQVLSRLMISLTVSAINRRDYPENDYLQITDQGAWDLFEKWINIHPNFAQYYFRQACNMSPLPYHKLIVAKIKSLDFNPILDPELLKECTIFDFKVGSLELGNFENYLDDARLNSQVQGILNANGSKSGIGRYHETRPFYTTDQFISQGNDGPSCRTVHIGLDLFAIAGTPVSAPYHGIIHSIRDNNSSRDYGPTIILKHELDGETFYTLYGHLSRSSLIELKPGQSINAGQVFTSIGRIEENGGWPPHLHFQIILDMMNYDGDFPGVCTFDEKSIWTQLSPDPGIITGIYSAPIEDSVDHLLQMRKERLGYNLSISYKNPLLIQRGMYQYLLDHTGRRYLDTVNNVAHCGHEHPRIIKRGQAQMAVLNTNTRYLHDTILELTEKLTSRLDPGLSVCYFTNSGTEANELAIRLAKTYTRQKDILTLQWAYHGNSELMVDLSSYKFDRKGGKGKPANTHVISMPDPYRGIYSKSEDPNALYLGEIINILNQLRQIGKAPAAFFAEAILSCGGQIVLPQGFMQKAIQWVRDAGGLYIADEVQTGLGRIGSHFCAYSLYDIIPDIVTFGKPLGNGHPIGAVVCRPEIASAFNNGMEYFNTFGGNPVSCSIASEVLNILSEEKLMYQAKTVGEYLKGELEMLKSQFSILGDIRGYGYFLGAEFIKEAKPGTLQASYFVERMKSKGILMSTDGPDDNVIKFKPPMCFNHQDASFLLEGFNKILREDFMQV